MVKLRSGPKVPMTEGELEGLFQGRAEHVSFVQEYVKLPSRGANNSCNNNPLSDHISP